jgi:hypothetical protein
MEAVQNFWNQRASSQTFADSLEIQLSEDSGFPASKKSQIDDKGFLT